VHFEVHFYLAKLEMVRIPHGNDLSMADAMILTTALRHDADELYTTDRDLQA